MTRPGADVREAKLLQELSDIARMKVDAEPFGNDTLEIDAPPALSHLARKGSLAAPCRLTKPLNLLNPSLVLRQVVSSRNG